jgi:hypothetical protein
MHNLINNDISRCNDYKCPTRAYCARFRQLHIDIKAGNTTFQVTDFQGRRKNGLCDNFINVD